MHSGVTGRHQGSSPRHPRSGELTSPRFRGRSPARTCARKTTSWCASYLPLRGELVSGARLPSEPAVAEHYGAAKMTIRRALRELRERGLITTVVCKGSYVS